MGGKPDEVPETTFSLKEVNGRLRFFCTATNNYKDRVGQYFPAAAHKEFIEWADETGTYPELWPWHIPGGPGHRLGVVDWMDFDGNFVLSSGLIDEGMEEKARTWAEDPDLAMSHGFLKRQIGDDVVQYRQFEESLLPRKFAANLWTDFTLGAKEMAFTPEKRTALAEKGYSEEEIAGMEGRVDTFRDGLAKHGISFKDVEEGESTTETPPEGEAPAGFTLDDVKKVVGEVVDEKLVGIKAHQDQLEAGLKDFREGADDYFGRLWESKASKTSGAPASRREDTKVAAGSKESTETKDPHAWVDQIPVWDHPIFGGGNNHAGS